MLMMVNDSKLWGGRFAWNEGRKTRHRTVPVPFRLPTLLLTVVNLLGGQARGARSVG